MFDSLIVATWHRRSYHALLHVIIIIVYWCGSIFQFKTADTDIQNGPVSIVKPRQIRINGA